LQLRELVIHLSLIKGIGPSAIKLIFERALGQPFSLKSDLRTSTKIAPDVVYGFGARDFANVVGLTERQAKLCVDGLSNLGLLEKELECVRQAGASILTILDENYPELLSFINQPPAALWTLGEPLKKQEKRLAVVGARAADSYAKSAVEKILPNIINSGWQIVSGGALGVDTLAHKEALKQGGKTVVVLGSGLSKLYPAENKKLFSQIAQSGGTLVSAFAMNVSPERGNFPARNRIIAGLCSGCVVVRAAEKSGALITSSYAMNEGREVFAVPGPIDSPLSNGPNRLLRDGANIATCGEELLEVLEGRNPVHIKRAEGAEDLEACEEFKTLKTKLLDELYKAKSLDDLSESLNIEVEVLAEELFTLQLSGLVDQTFAGTWEKI
jgi:DNA processing protein